MGRKPSRLPYYGRMEEITNLRLGYDWFVYKDGSDYIAVDGSSGKEEFTDSKADVAINGAIANSTYVGRIQLSDDTFDISASIDYGLKAIQLSGAGVFSTLTNRGTVIRPVSEATFGANWVISVGSASSTLHGPVVRDLVIDGRGYGTPLGGIQYRNCKIGTIERVVVNDMYRTSTRGVGIKILGDSGYGAYYNQIVNCRTRRCTTGIEMGELCNSSMIIGGFVTGRTSTVATYGIHGSGADTITIYGTDIENNEHTDGIGLYIDSDLAWKMIGTRFENNWDDIIIDAGAGTGSHTFLGCTVANTSGDIVQDSGNAKSKYDFAFGFVTRNSGASANVSDGGSIAHGLASTPTHARVTPTVAAEMASVTAMDATNLTIAIKDDAGAAGTQQTIYWEAEYQP